LDGELHIAGCSYVPATPFGISDWDRVDAPGWKPPAKHLGPIFSDTGRKVTGTMSTLLARPTISETLTELASKSPPAQTVYVIHAPPARTKLDMLFGREHIGSGAVREFIEKFQLPLTLHGHIHESRQVSGSISDRIGRTWSLNPGDSKETLNAVLIEIDGGRVAWKGLK
jgi:Icc-related predicted phosphoesterase